MAEFLLKCPKCETVYKLPVDAVPDQGREVECSTCSHTWVASAFSPVDTGSAISGSDQTGADVIRHDPVSETEDKPELPDRKDVMLGQDPPSPIKKRLSVEVLNILREEVEFERRARKAQSAPLIGDSFDEDWPATTVTEPSPKKKPIEPIPAPLPEPANEKPAIDETPPPPPLADLAIYPASTPEIGTAQQAQMTERSEPQRTPEINDKVKGRRKTRYRTGFWLGLTVAAAAAVLYVYLPDIADKGPAAERLMEIRQQIDKGRLWLDERVTNLIGLL